MNFGNVKIMSEKKMLTINSHVCLFFLGRDERNETKKKSSQIKKKKSIFIQQKRHTVFDTDIFRFTIFHVNIEIVFATEFSLTNVTRIWSRFCVNSDVSFDVFSSGKLLMAMWTFVMIVR